MQANQWRPLSKVCVNSHMNNLSDKKKKTTFFEIMIFERDKKTETLMG